MQNIDVIKLSNNFILSKKKNIINFKNIFASFFIVFLIVCIVIKPALCISSIYSGLAVWAKCVLPSLLPFMFFTKLLTNLNFISKITSSFYKLNRILYKAPKISGYIFLISIISGYPVGAKMISEYYKMGLITKKEANKLSTFCSTSGPLFIIGSVGTAMLGSAKLGYILFLSHLLGSILNGIIYRNVFIETKTNKSNLNNFTNNINTYPNNNRNEKPNYYNKNNTSGEKLASKKNAENMLAKSMNDSILSVLLVGGYISIAFLVIDIFNSLNLFYPINFVLSKLGLPNDLISSLTSGVLEVSKGCLNLANVELDKIIILPVASFLIGFGGICVLLQATTFLKDAKINLKFYILQKITHGILSAIVCFLLCIILKI